MGECYICLDDSIDNMELCSRCFDLLKIEMIKSIEEFSYSCIDEHMGLIDEVRFLFCNRHHKLRNISVCVKWLNGYTSNCETYTYELDNLINEYLNKTSILLSN